MKVYCNDLGCKFCRELDEKHSLKSLKTPLFEDSGFKGVCEKDEIGIGYREIIVNDVKYKVPVCESRSDKKISGHVDFSRIGIPQYVDEDGVKAYEREKNRQVF